MTWLELATRIVVVAVAFAVASCSFSYSSKSSSDSSKGSSESSSRSSESSSGSSSPAQARERQYKEDVADYTQAYVVSGGAQGSFLSGVGALAEKRGISDWESETATWEGIGLGLARANVKKDQVAVYIENWCGDDAEAKKGVQRGYDRGK